MGRPRALAIVAAVTLATSLLLGTGSTSAGKACRHPANSYDRGGTPAGGLVDDPLFQQQWGLQRVKAPGAWKKGASGKGAVIAILDTGIDLGHPDLRDRIVRGVDLASDSDCPGPQDEWGHGTAVAGVAAASANNGMGIAGVAPRARLMPVRVLTGSESTKTPEEIERLNKTFAKGIRWAADHRADVINISSTLMLVTDFPGGGLKQALQYAWDKGVVVVAAAGNNLSFPICDYPANDAHVVCVGATDELGLPAFYSNQPLNSNSQVGLRAPGGRGIPSCDESSEVWTTHLPGQCSGGISGYMSANGTSFASPHVAGVAALLAGAGLTNQEIVNCLTATALNPLTGLRGQSDPVYGYGEVDAEAAIQECG